MKNLLTVPSMEVLCENFLHSEEFRRRFGSWQTPFDWPPLSVETDVTQDKMARLIEHVERTWNSLGAADPYWSVISRPEFRKENFSAHEESFRESGRMDVDRFSAFVSRAGLSFDRFRCCLELGCGVGRVTQWLCKLFPRVIATDISSQHLAILQRQVGSPSVETFLLSNHEVIKSLPAFDVFFSIIVLQHNPPPVIALFLKSILDKLQADGIAYFQLPTYKVGYRFDTEWYLNNLATKGEMEMHILPQKTVYEIADFCGCAVIEVREDGYTGDPDAISNTFLLHKKS